MNILTTIPKPYHEVYTIIRAFEANAKSQPAYLEVICSQHPVYGGWVRTSPGGE